MGRMSEQLHNPSSLYALASARAGDALANAESHTVEALRTTVPSTSSLITSLWMSLILMTSSLMNSILMNSILMTSILMTSILMTLILMTSI